MSFEKVKTILYASDLIGHDSKPVFRVAVNHAIAHQAKLIFLNVVEPISAMSEAAISNYISSQQLSDIRRNTLRSIQNDIVERIQSFCKEELSGKTQLSFDSEVNVVQGHPAEAILQVAKDAQVDMIVMGTRTHSKLGQMVVGSTAHQVLFHAECPVLVVPIH